MLNITLDRAIDVSTAATFGFMSVSGLMASSRCQVKSACPSNSSSSSETPAVCPVTPCGRANLKLAVGAGLMTSALYLYRGYRG
jgi:hypothetical protein